VVADRVRKETRNLLKNSTLTPDEAEALILGYVIAHETGHLLLPRRAHSLKGLMSPTLKMDNVAAGGALLFLPQENKRIRAVLLRESQSGGFTEDLSLRQ